jgi:acetyl esterase/lipase
MRKASLLAAGTLFSAALSLATLGYSGGAAVAAAPQGQPGIPASGVKADADNQAVLDALKSLGLRPYHTLSPAEARLQPSFADGVKAVMHKQGRPAVPPPGIATQDIQVAGGAGPIPARVYRPADATGPLPVIVYYHGGGWVLATIDTYDTSARALAREARAIVISVEYRKAPEAKFPAQHDDALAAYRWALGHAGELNGDPRKVALAGESAGGNLAIATAIAARDARLQKPTHVLAVYPIAGSDLNTPSYQENANAMPLNRAAMAWFLHHTTRGPADATDPRINLIAANLRGLPAVTLIQAQIDPLTSEGQTLTGRLRAAGVSVTSQLYPGVTHEFFGADAVIRKAGEAQRFAGQKLKASFR